MIFSLLTLFVEGNQNILCLIVFRFPKKKNLINQLHKSQQIQYSRRAKREFDPPTSDLEGPSSPDFLHRFLSGSRHPGGFSAAWSPDRFDFLSFIFFQKKKIEKK